MLSNKIIHSFRKKTAISSTNFDHHFDHLISFLKEKGGNHASHLIFLQDKEIYWTKDRNVLIIYKKFANKFVVLGDPIGDELKIQESIKEFCEYSKNKGYNPVFYQISPKYMQYYHDSGYRFVKLGEEGLVHLDQFTIEGKQGAKLRNRLNKFNRKSYTFQVVDPPHSVGLLSELKHISDSWLGNQKEKGFSVVSFSEEYVSSFPIALLHDPDGKTIAFSTLATDYKNTITIDLMRKNNDSPHGTMDVLFIHIFNWAKEHGFSSCSLGMTPLSNVGKCKHSFTSEKIIRLAYLYGNSLYNFKGLRDFKGKFASDWEPKYLAFKKTSLPITCLQLLFLIHRKDQPKNIVTETNQHILNNKVAFRVTTK